MIKIIRYTHHFGFFTDAIQQAITAEGFKRTEMRAIAILGIVISPRVFNYITTN